jgi:hypothetical protein
MVSGFWRMKRWQKLGRAKLETRQRHMLRCDRTTPPTDNNHPIVRKEDRQTEQADDRRRDADAGAEEKSDEESGTKWSPNRKAA